MCSFYSVVVAATLIFCVSFGDARTDEGRVPVKYGGEKDLDSCGSSGRVAGLDANGDDFLSVRVGPAKAFAMIDQLGSGRQVSICDERGNWLGIVYGPPGANCGTGSPLAKRQAYKGVCKSGWVYKHYVERTSG